MDIVDDVIYRMDLESKCCIQFLVFGENVSVFVMGVNICANDIFVSPAMFSNKSILLDNRNRSPWRVMDGSFT